MTTGTEALPDDVHSVIESDVIIIGAGPTGLSIANLLGLQGVRVTLIEQLDKLIDYPRGVGIDDESLRSVQTMGLVDRVLPYTVPQQIMRLVNARGGVIVEIRPATVEFGWSRRNGFLQPDVDRVLFEGLDRFENVEVRFGRTVTSMSDTGDLVEVAATTADGTVEHYRAQYLVGADGGKSPVRKHIGVSFEGQSPSTRFLVADVRNDPIGTPNAYLGCDPRRPYVSIGLPQGIRRFEFLLFDDEPDEIVEDQAFVDKLLAPHVADTRRLDFVRKRVYTHHSRIAGRFSKGRIFVAGDAAHLMPVWQGQGWNSGERDATNLAWKLGAVINGRATPRLLETYDEERRDHAKAMIDLSTAFGRIVKPTNRLVAGVRDLAANVLNLSPAVKEYFGAMRYKPMPKYTKGAIVDVDTLRPGHSSGQVKGTLSFDLAAKNRHSPVGTQFIQPRVAVDGGPDALLDDVVGYGWVVAQWGGNPENLFTGGERETLRALGAKLVSLRPVAQMSVDRPNDPDAIVVGDRDGALKRWFDDRPTAVVFIRPDRFVAAASSPQQAAQALRSVAIAASLVEPASRPQQSPAPSAPAVDVAGVGARLLESWRSRVAVDPVERELEGGGLDAAYEVQEIIIAGRESAANPRVGRKVGLTSPAVQQQLGVDQPDFGVLLRDMQVSGGERVPMGALIQPKVEAEIAFVLKDDVLEPTREAVVAAVDYATPALEIVDSRIRDWKISITDTIADNASSAMFVLGDERVPLEGLDTVGAEMSMSVGGETVSTGSGAACLGDPINALVWVAETAARLGRPLRAGEVVLSGALGPMAVLEPGAVVEATISGVGTVRVTASDREVENDTDNETTNENADAPSASGAKGRVQA